MCPLVKIEIIEGKSSEYKNAILDGVHQALMKSLGIPDSDRFRESMRFHLITLNIPRIEHLM